jgi:hypothetical protein
LDKKIEATVTDRADDAEAALQERIGMITAGRPPCRD